MSLYVKLDVNVFDNDALIECSVDAQLVFIHGLCLAKRLETDGEFTISQLRRDCAGIDELDKLVEELIEVGLWCEDEAGRVLTIQSWLQHNLSQAEVAVKRERASAAGKRGGRGNRKPESP
jgi:hypothetical protein